MIETLEEINERFNLIKNDRPKATKKLNELGDILASAYRINPELADEMWQYIIDLNTSDNISNIKFYVAQIFSKIMDRLSMDEATSFISMSPERVKYMILYGYDGYRLWDILDTLIRGYIKINSIELAERAVRYFYEKFDGIHSERKEIFRITRIVATICNRYIQEGEYITESEKLLDAIGNSENQDVNTIVEIVRTVSTSDRCENYDMLFFLTNKCKEPVEFFDLLWEAREKFSLDELRDKWDEYVEACNEKEVGPYNNIQEAIFGTVPYKESKLRFYVEMEKYDDILLEHYFSKPTLYTVEKGVVTAWICDSSWDYFTKYLSQVVMVANDETFLSLKSILKNFMDACFYDECVDCHDKYGRSYKEMIQRSVKDFVEALAQISAITVGCDCHASYHAFIKDFIQKLNGNLDVLNAIGFEDKVEKRSPFEQLKAYVGRFNKSRQKVCTRADTEYSLIMDKFTRGVFSQEAIAKAENEAYQMACDNEIATFFFTKFPSQYDWRKNMLSACIKKGNVDRAVELIDMMASTKVNSGYDKLNGWGRQNMLTIMYLIRRYDYNKTDCLGYEADGITDEMRETTKALVERMLPSLPPHTQEELKDEMHKIIRNSDAFDDYIDQLLNDVALYTTFPKPRGKESAPVINRLSSTIMASFEQLSANGRVDIISKIMSSFAEVKDILCPVTYDTWVSMMMREISDDDVHKIFQNNPEIFEALIEYENVREDDLVQVAKRLGKCCTRREYMSFRDMVFAQKGVIEGVDNCFVVTSENSTTQLLFEGETAKVELDYLEVNDARVVLEYKLYDIAFHFCTTKKTSDLDSVRVTSCKVNGIESVNEFIYMFNDDPHVGYGTEEEYSKSDITLYGDFLEKNNISLVEKIELEMVCVDDNNSILESLSPVVIDYDTELDEFIVTVTKEGKRQV